MESKLVLLDDSALDSVVGGVYNQKVIKDLNLEVRTGTSGAQGLYVSKEYSEGSIAEGHFESGSSKGWISDDNLRKYVKNHENASISVRTNTGEMKELNKSQLTALLS